MTSSPALAVIKREFLSGLRSPKPFLFLTVLMIIMIAGLVFTLGIVLQQTLRFGGTINGQNVRELFMIFSMGLYLSAILLVPPMAAVSICTEKQQDSYDLLRMTYISPFSLAVAKLFNVLGIYTLIAIATMPIVGVFFFLVGIDWAQFVQSAIIIALSALSSAVIGLACSAKFYRTLPAIMTTYFIGFLTQGGLLFGIALFGELMWPYSWMMRIINRFDEQLASILCPFFSLAMLGEGRLTSFFIVGGYYSFSPIILIALYHGFLVFIGMRITLAILRRPTEPMRVDQEKPIDDQTVLEARRKRFPYYLIDPRRRRPMIHDGANPVYRKELQTGLLGKGTFGVRIFYGFTIFCLFVAIFAVVESDFGYRSAGAFVAWPVLIDTIVILILTPALVAMGMSKEHEWGNLDMLRMTLLEPWQIIDGKFRTGLFTAALPVAGAVLGSLPLAIFGWHDPAAWSAAITGFGSMIVCVVYTLALTLTATATCKRGITALMMGYGTAVFALVLFPLFIAFLYIASQLFWGNSSNFDDSEAQVVAYLSPLAAHYVNIESGGRFGNREMFNSYWFTNCVAFVGLSILLFGAASHRFSRHIKRGVG